MAPAASVRLRGWALTLACGGGASALLLAAATLSTADGAVAAVLVALGLAAGVMIFSLPVLAAMGLAPTAAFLVAMSTYALQVLLGALLLRAGRDGGSLDGVVDQRWLGASLVTLALSVTAGVVADQLRGARTAGTPEGGAPAAGEGDLTSQTS